VVARLRSLRGVGGGSGVNVVVPLNCGSVKLTPLVTGVVGQFAVSGVPGMLVGRDVRAFLWPSLCKAQCSFDGVDGR